MASDEVLLEYAVRVSVLADHIAHTTHLARQQASIRASLPRSNSNAGGPSSNHHSSSSSNHHASGSGSGSSISDGLNFLAGLKDTIGKSGSDRKSGKSKLGKDVIRGLEARLRGIAKGEDQRFKDDAFRRTCAIFWGNWQDSDWVKQMISSRSPEELILPFVTCCVKTVKKSTTIPEPRQNAEVNDQIRNFIVILRDTVGSVGGSGMGEVLQRLDGYLSGMKERKKEEEEREAREREVGASVGSSTAHDSMAMATTTLKLFGIRDESDVKGRSRTLKGLCTAKNALKDVQLQLDLLSGGHSVFIESSDFYFPEGYDTWTRREKDELEERKNYYAGLAQSRIADRVDAGGYDGTSSQGHGSSTTLIFVPPEPRQCYLNLLRRCLDLDLDDMANLSDNDMVSLAILSEQHIGLLDEIAGHWRISMGTRLAAHAGLLVDLLQEDGVPVECVMEALTKLRQYIQQTDKTLIMREDLRLVFDLIQKIIDYVVSCLSELMASYDRAHPDQVNEVCDLLLILDDLEEIDPEAVHELQSDLKRRVEELERLVAKAAERKYLEMWDKRADRVDLALFEAAKWIEKHTKTLDKRYPVSILDALDIVPIVLRVQMPHFARALTSLKDTHLATDGTQNDPRVVEADDVFQLYKTVHKLLDLFKAYLPKTPFGIDVNRLFDPLILAWLRQMHMRVRQWVDKAIELDDFRTRQIDGSTSSVTDVFTSLHSIVKAVNELKWTDSRRHADFVAEVALIDMLVVTRYGETLKQKFLSEMAEVKELPDAPSEETGWKAMASRVARREKPVVKPFDFSASICLKLNDIEKAMSELDRLYWDLDIDQYAEGHSIHTAGGTSSLYSVRIVRADLSAGEGMEDSSVRTQVMLSDERGQPVAVTRIVNDSAYPRWDEVFDLTCENKMWLMASIRNVGNDNQRAGRAYVKLDDRAFPEMVARDLWLPLDMGGRLLLKVSREKEKDDAQFYFGKTFRRLKLIETDMIRYCVDKMMPFVRSCISRKILKGLFRGSTGSSVAGSTTDAINKLAAVYRSAMTTSENLIPAVKEANHQKVAQNLTDVQVETAIGPLLDYFDDNLQVLSASLSSNNLRGVLLRLWKEILVAIEDMIVPPLSDRPSEMRPLTDGELDVVLKWLKFLRDYFYASGDSNGIPLEELQTQPYQEILRVRIYYDWNTDDLMEECVRDFQKTLKTAYGVRGRSKTIKSQRNLGTMKRDRDERRRQQTGAGSSEMILRVLRMRRGTQEFLSDQLRMMYRSE